MLILVIVVERLAKGEQFNSQGLADIIQLANLMNKLSQRKSTAYDMIGVSPIKDIPENTHTKVKPVKLTSEFIIGLIDGDGSFYVSFAKDRKIKFGFNITGSIRDKVLFNDVKEELGCGTIRVLSPTALRYNIESIKAIRDKLVPFVDKYK